LNFYAQKRVIPVTEEELNTYWKQKPSAYFLVNQKIFQEFNLQESSLKHYQAPPNWHLITPEAVISDQ
jgi:hypothetical protein